MGAKHTDLAGVPSLLIEAPPQKIEQFSFLDHARAFTSVAATEMSLVSVVILFLVCFFILEWQPGEKPLTIVLVVAFCLPWVLFIGEKVTRIRAARAASVTLMHEEHVKQKHLAHRAMLVEAEIEKLTGLDLNRSGQVGDVEKVVEHHLIDSEGVQREKHVILVGEFALLRDYFVEFVHEQATRGIKRTDWLGDGKRPAFCFKDGNPITREIYDACISILEDRAHVIHGNGSARRVVCDPAAIMEILRM